jgi:hypothetical protein
MRGSAQFVNEKIKKPLLIAEIGTCQGRNAIAMLTEMNIERLYLIDSYPNYVDGPFERKGKIQEDYYRLMFSNLKPYLSKITFVTRDSVWAASLFQNEFFDYVYVDGFHSRVQCKKDMEVWWPKVRKGGVLGGHDIGHVDFPGVAKAVEEFSKRMARPFMLGDGSDWIIEKL